MPWKQICIFFGLVWLIRLGIFGLFPKKFRLQKWLVVALLCSTFFTILIIPAQYFLLRFLAGIYLFMNFCKYIDYWATQPQILEDRTGFIRFWLFLECPYTLLFEESFVRKNPVHIQKSHLKTLLKGSIYLNTGVILWYWNIQAQLWQTHLYLNYICKMLEFTCVIVGVNDVFFAILRMLGFEAKDVMLDPHLARSPGDFWRRYDAMVFRWLYRYIFIPTGGKQRPIVAILLVFLFSGIFHECILIASHGQWNFYMIAFFGLHGIAVVICRGMGLLFSKKFPLLVNHPAIIISQVLANNIFVISSSILFFASAELIFQIHPGAPRIFLW